MKNQELACNILKKNGCTVGNSSSYIMKNKDKNCTATFFNLILVWDFLNDFFASCREVEIKKYNLKYIKF
jgi:hypothetical protein